MVTRRNRRNYIVIVLIVVVGGYWTLKIGQGVYEIWRLTRMLHAEQRRFDEALRRIESLEKEMKMLRDDLSYIEKIAREEYGMIKEGEEVFRISLPEERGEAKESED